ncbi:hypothetical protein PCANC_01044 [Puccinia coronata f. sp. avenae]|uniref:Uncharacterized protein n=1 Tax=Puccinia coronata f. sp. avenae TaxID=200324 RepID=A0A2N5W6N3_9BASI|nr:hypothetical protein PCANC_14580 [Puccinia coronata f. sp. avenae]PLW57901.1 hypothetical protein PCANC_01044 [Puccinia coronata f. sp. avenae]
MSQQPRATLLARRFSSPLGAPTLLDAIDKRNGRKSSIVKQNVRNAIEVLIKPSHKNKQERAWLTSCNPLRTQANMPDLMEVRYMNEFR